MHLFRYFVAALLLSLIAGNSDGADQRSFDRAKATIRHNDLPALQKLAETDPTVLTYRDDVANFSLMHIAAMNGASKIVQYLLSQHLDPNAIDGMNMTPVHWSVVARSLETLKVLADGGANLHFNDSSDYLLNDAIGLDAVNIVKYLLSKGFSPTFNSGLVNYPLRAAAYSGNTEIAAVLLAAGSNINQQEGDAETPLTTAVTRGNLEMVKYLLDHGARQDLKFPTSVIPIVKALKYGKLPIIKLLVERGAVLKGENQDEPAVCALARLSDDTTIANLLLEHGMDINAVEQKSGATAPQLAVWYQHHNISRWLVEHGVRTDAVDSNGDTLPVLCAKAFDIQTMRLLQTRD